MADGKSTKEIAAEMGVSAKTAEYHRAKLGEKIGVSGVQPLTAIAARSIEARAKDLNPQVFQPISVKSIDDLEKAIVKMAEDAVNGKANPVQVQCIVSLTGALCDLATLKWKGVK